MSYILDALRRSEQDRRRLQSHHELIPPQLSHDRRRRRSWLLVLLIAINLATIAWLLLRTGPDSDLAHVPQSVQTASPQRLPALEELTGQPAPAPVMSPAATPTATPAVAPTALPPAEPTASPPPLLAELPEHVRKALPELHISVHVYAGKPAARFVHIDGRSYREQHQVSDQLVLEEITLDGAILNYQGQRFRVLR